MYLGGIYKKHRAMKHSQTGWIFIAAFAIINSFPLFTETPDSIKILLFLVSVIILLLFFNLTIEVDDKNLRMYFGIGVISKRYKLDDIIGCKPISYIPFGWGIRWRPGVILYNVSGYKAIELNIRGKRHKIWIGTDKPQEIADHINNKLQKKI
jgi:hypothetical protein